MNSHPIDQTAIFHFLEQGGSWVHRHMDKTKVVTSAYREACFAAREKGLVGHDVERAILHSAASVSSRLLGHPVSQDEVAQIIGIRLY